MMKGILGLDTVLTRKVLYVFSTENLTKQLPAHYLIQSNRYYLLYHGQVLSPFFRCRN